MSDADSLVRQLAGALIKNGCRLSVAESCTGGLLSAHCTSISGSSAWFDRAWLAYSNEAKQEMLDVPMYMLQEQGAVSLAVTEAMALACLEKSSADVSIAISGVAGPGGGSTGKPVGMVCFTVAQGNKGVISVQKLFKGNRQDIRQQAVLQSLAMLITALQ